MYRGTPVSGRKEIIVKENRKFRKILALVLALAMVLSSGVAVLAEDPADTKGEPIILLLMKVKVRR